LTTIEVCRVLEDIARRGDGTMVVLTGGEPLVRPDIEEITAFGTQLELAMVVGTNGTLLTARRVGSLKQAGLLGAGISVDSLDPDRHDSFRGRPGSWAKTMAGIENCRQYELNFQIHFSVTEDNADELPSMAQFAAASGARVLNVFFLVCTGRGESITDISPQRYEQILTEIIDMQERNPGLIIRPRCAPHFKRVAYQRDPDALLNRISGKEGDGCIAGSHYCRITPEGGVTACPYISDEVGNIRRRSFMEIWDDSPQFNLLRQPKLSGRCGGCEFQKLCGGCRARPLALGGDLMDADPWCVYEPEGRTPIEPLANDELAGLSWSADAAQRLQRVPAFLRKMVRKRAEAYVAGLGEQQVTPAHLAVLSARRFGNSKPLSRPQ
jgi:radical SAM protein with 4Fe4S-binding SPASM domain